MAGHEWPCWCDTLFRHTGYEYQTSWGTARKASDLSEEGSKAFEYIKVVHCCDLVKSCINICCRWCVIGSLIPGPSILDKPPHDKGSQFSWLLWISEISNIYLVDSSIRPEYAFSPCRSLGKLQTTRSRLKIMCSVHDNQSNSGLGEVWHLWEEDIKVQSLTMNNLVYFIPSNCG